MVGRRKGFAGSKSADQEMLNGLSATDDHDAELPDDFDRAGNRFEETKMNSRNIPAEKISDKISAEDALETLSRLAKSSPNIARADKETGLLFAQGDFRELAACVSDLLLDAALAARIAKPLKREPPVFRGMRRYRRFRHFITGGCG